MKKLLPLVLCFAIAAMVTADAAKGAGGKPPANPNVTVAFNGQAGDGILGDPLGSYVGGGVGGIVALQPSGTTPAWSGFANLYFLLSNMTKAKRYYVLNYPPESVVDNGCGLAGGPTATNVKVKNQIYIKSIGAMAIGEARVVRMHVKTPDNEFHWSEGVGTESCSGVVAAYRPSWNMWIVSTDVARLGLPGCGVPGIQAGTCVTDGSGAGTGWAAQRRGHQPPMSPPCRLCSLAATEPRPGAGGAARAGTPMSAAYRPSQVMPSPLGEVADKIPHWFVIGGPAVRCWRRPPAR